MNLLKGLIQCGKCGKNYKYKNERGRGAYICSGYANYGKEFCTRRKVNEEDLIFVIKTGFFNYGIEWERDNDYISHHIKEVIVDENGEIEIKYFKYPSTFWNFQQLGNHSV